MKEMSDEEKDAVMQHFDNTIGKSIGIAGQGKPFEAIWPQIDAYNDECRKAEKYLLSMASKLSDVTPMKYTTVLNSLANAIDMLLLKGGIVAAVTLDKNQYIILENYGKGRFE